MKTKNLDTLLLLDGNHIAYRAYYKFSRLKDFDGNSTSVIFGMPYIIESLIRQFTPDKVLLVFDGGRSQFRKDLLPDYKQREQKLGFDRESFYEQKDNAMDLLMALGVNVVWKKGFEADDLIAMVARRYSKREWWTIIVSGDKDFNQLVTYPVKGMNGEISIWNTGKGKMLNYLTLSKLVGYRAEQCVDYLCLTGDKSDHIKGYPGIGPKRAQKLLEKYGNIGEFLKSGDKFGKVDNKTLVEIWQLNKKLIDLKYFYRRFLIQKSIPLLGGGFLNEKAFKKYCAKHETNSFLKPQFLNTFKKLHHGN